MRLPSSLKKLFTFRRGRVNPAREARQLRVLTKNLDRQAYRRLTSMFNKFVKTRAYLYKEYGYYNDIQAAQALNEEMFATMLAHYKRVLKAIYKHNEDRYNLINKDAENEAIVFGRNVDIEELAILFFNRRKLILAGISQRIANRIDKIIEDGRAEGLSVVQISKRISDQVLPIGRGRAALIARTETHNAASFANHQYHTKVKNDYGVKMMKQWVSSGDPRTRSAHAAANGQIVDMDEDFNIGGAAMQYAGDPKGGAKNVINCRCAIIYVDESDIVLE